MRRHNLKLKYKLATYKAMKIIVIMIVIKIQITTILCIPAPTQIIITGPSAIFGREFSTTMYGSKIFRSVSLHHNKIAIKQPTTVEIIKPNSVSNKVIPI